MRILIAGEFSPNPPEVYGGIAAVNYALAEGLRTFRDIELHVLTCENNIPQDRDTEFRGVRIYYRRSPALPHTFCMFSIDPWKIRRVIQQVRPDVVHVHGSTSYPFAALSLPYPVVMTVHGIMRRETEFSYGVRWRDWLRFRLGSYMERRNLQRAPHVIASSPYVAEQIRDDVRGRLYAVPNPISSEFFDLKGEEEEGLVLCASRIQPRKGLLDLLKAAEIARQEIPGLRIRITGVARIEWKGYFETLTAFVRERQLEDTVEFTGYLKRADMLKNYSACQVFVLPSVEESSPMAIAQAMAAGKPVVARRIGGMAHLVRHGETGFLFEEAAALARQLIELFSNHAMRQKMGSQGREIAMRELSSATVASRMLAIYQKIAGLGQPAAAGQAGR